MRNPLLHIRAIIRITDKILWIAYDDKYAMCMTWLRASEFHESPEEQFKLGKFKILDYIDWYAHNKGKGVFTYPTDWEGFNIGSEWLTKLYVEQKQLIPDWSDYDDSVEAIMRYANAVCGEEWALCATMYNRQRTLKHEIAHALWATEPSYQEAQLQVIESSPQDVIVQLRNNLSAMGYGEDVLDDEVHAYLACELTTEVTKGCPRPAISAIRKALRVNLKPYFERIIPTIPQL